MAGGPASGARRGWRWRADGWCSLLEAVLV